MYRYNVSREFVGFNLLLEVQVDWHDLPGKIVSVAMTYKDHVTSIPITLNDLNGILDLVKSSNGAQNTSKELDGSLIEMEYKFTYKLNPLLFVRIGADDNVEVGNESISIADSIPHLSDKSFSIRTVTCSIKQSVEFVNHLFGQVVRGNRRKVSDRPVPKFSRDDIVSNESSFHVGYPISRGPTWSDAADEWMYRVNGRDMFESTLVMCKEKPKFVHGQEVYAKCGNVRLVLGHVIGDAYPEDDQWHYSLNVHGFKDPYHVPESNVIDSSDLADIYKAFGIHPDLTPKHPYKCADKPHIIDPPKFKAGRKVRCLNGPHAPFVSVIDSCPKLLSNGSWFYTLYINCYLREIVESDISYAEDIPDPRFVVDEYVNVMISNYNASGGCVDVRSISAKVCAGPWYYNNKWSYWVLTSDGTRRVERERDIFDIRKKVENFSIPKHLFNVNDIVYVNFGQVVVSGTIRHMDIDYDKREWIYKIESKESFHSYEKLIVKNDADVGKLFGIESEYPYDQNKHTATNVTNVVILPPKFKKGDQVVLSRGIDEPVPPDEQINLGNDIETKKKMIKQVCCIHDGPWYVNGRWVYDLADLRGDIVRLIGEDALSYQAIAS